MTHLEIVKKIIGPTHPIGKTEVDEDRLNNLKSICNLADDLISELKEVYYHNLDSSAHSIRTASDYAKRHIIYLQSSVKIIDHES